MELPRVYDQQGGEQDWDWLVANFGAVSLERAETLAGASQVYHIVKLQDVEGPAVQTAYVVDSQGVPLEKITVVRYWPDAPGLPEWQPPTSRWRDRGVHGETKKTGEIGFGMGYGDYYFPPAGGASAMWVAGETGPSDWIGGLGMLGGSNHRHLDVTFQRQDASSEPPSQPPLPSLLASPPPILPLPPSSSSPSEEEARWARLFERLDRIIELLETPSS